MRNRRAFLTPNPTDKRKERFAQLKLVTSFNIDSPARNERQKPASISIQTNKTPSHVLSRKYSTGRGSKRMLFVIVVRSTQKGKQITKEYIEKLKQVFDRVGKGLRRIEPEAMYKYLKSNPNFEQEASKFLSHNNDRLNHVITFRDFLSIILEDATEIQINNMLGWITDDITPYYDNARLPINSRRKMTINTARAFQQLFKHLDTDGDGLLSLNEVQTAFEKTVTQQTITKYFREYDQDGRNKINAPQFIRMVAPHNMEVPHDVIEAVIKT